MKYWTAMLVALALALALSGCGDSAHPMVSSGARIACDHDELTVWTDRPGVTRCTFAPPGGHVELSMARWIAGVEYEARFPTPGIATIEFRVSSECENGVSGWTARLYRGNQFLHEVRGSVAVIRC